MISFRSLLPAAVAAAALSQRVSEPLLDRALRRLAHTLPDTLSHDGGHAFVRDFSSVHLVTLAAAAPTP